VPAWDAETEAAIRSRCRVIAARFDDRNRPHIDLAEMRDAVLAPAAGTIDSGYFRALMMSS